MNSHRKTRRGREKTAPTARSSFATYLKLAHQLADRSGEAILPYFRKPIAVENKAGTSGYDPVTAADRKAEKLIVRMIKEHFPDHGIAGEEFGSAGDDAPLRWVIDPIDGTRAFIAGTPMWGTLIGLLERGAPILGIMDQPYTGERFWSAQNASYARDARGKVRRMKTRRCPRLGDALLMTTCPHLFAKGAESDGFARIKSGVRMTRYGGDCYSYCLLASGFVDLVVEAGLKPYDVVALIPIVERAGGVITSWDGGSPAEGGRIVACGDPALHADVIRLLSR